MEGPDHHDPALLHYVTPLTLPCRKLHLALTIERIP
jgi:hypothetical protein